MAAHTMARVGTTRVSIAARQPGRSAGTNLRKGWIVTKTDEIQLEATVIKALPNAMFTVEADMSDGKHEALCTIAGKMRKHYIRILPGDRVTVVLSPYDLSRGRIIYRHR